MEPPAGLCRGSGQGDRSHRQLSAPDLPGRRTGVGTTQPAAAGTVRLITQNHNLTEGWKDPLSVKQSFQCSVYSVKFRMMMNN